MASTDSDLQTDLRKRARRRLLGAIALALTAAIVLPIVMDHEPRPPAQDIAVRIPSRDAVPPLASPVREAQPDTEPAPPPAPPDSEPLPASRPEVPKPTPAAPAVKPEAPKPPPAESAKPTPKPEAKPEPVKPVAKPVPSPTEAARAAALLDGQATAFALQLGVFSDAANVAKLRSRAKELGFASFTEDVKLADGQTRTRVKVGPFSSRTAAEAAQRKLEAAGMRSMIAPRS
ncbi:SPOR domain-containing protein [Methyloversatilis discipulorum]|uniref:SPOR domain-containing protein n=1 Tax=Methyloversatilis discipulorum TaxID=1119528 RepID=UPI001A417D56|nr:SPOR domain-containing protein [Methyloversatilis discipulorum]MBL8468694.1 SPOR domain-containing protein [Methyloversatilis discipulorum]